MNEIEELYENAGIKSVVRDNAIGRGYYIEHQRVEEYPPFTAEKQIALIKLLGELDILEIMRPNGEEKVWIINSWCGMSENVYRHTSRMKFFEEALAKLINSLWQDLTEKEKQQVKGILE